MFIMFPRTKSKIAFVQKSKAIRLYSSAVYNKKKAKSLAKVEYYIAMGKDIKALAHRETEKIRVRTPQWEHVTDLLEEWRMKGEDPDKKIVTGKILLGIYKANLKAALSVSDNTPPVHYNIINLVSRPELLLLAYTKIRGNSGAFAKASWFSKNDWINLSPEGRACALRGLEFPDGISLASFFFISSLLRKGLYPWGVSRRIYVEKPGTTVLRPLTIPPFMDRIVQQCILTVLESIFEPWFEARNRSFGFRPNKSCHDAITALKTGNAIGLNHAVEGDIKGAFNKVDRGILINILEKRIKDKRFIDMIRNRLEYEFTQGTGADFQRIRETEGTPQGGIESPYLWNIYMLSFDEYIHTELQSFINSLNLKRGYKVSYTRANPDPPYTAAGSRIRWRQIVIKKKIAVIKLLFSRHSLTISSPSPVWDVDSGLFLPLAPDVIDFKRLELYQLLRDYRLLVHQNNFKKKMQDNKRFLRIFYVRYADDWILLHNGDERLGIKLKSLISKWLMDNLKATLSDEKTKITNLKKECALFLGFELSIRRNNKLQYVTVAGSEKPGCLPRMRLQRQRSNIKISPDRQRLITRLHIRGYCTPSGFPREMPWLSTLEGFMIIERFNAVLQGLSNYYNAYMSYNSDLDRWIYIIRYSCLKTLAQKYRTTISGVFKKFGTSNTMGKTITISYTLRINKDEEYIRKWRLLTYKDLRPKREQFGRAADLAARFNKIQKKESIGDYPLPLGAFPKVTNLAFLDKLTWVSLRTQAAFDMPCAICGRIGDTQMHHIRHIRKRAYALIPVSMPWEQVMALRNRKQLPVCTMCHRSIHSGTFNGPSLRKLRDNRILHVSSFVKPGMVYHAQSLVEKGWVRIVVPGPI